MQTDPTTLDRTTDDARPTRPVRSWAVGALVAAGVWLTRPIGGLTGHLEAVDEVEAAATLVRVPVAVAGLLVLRLLLGVPMLGVFAPLLLALVVVEVGIVTGVTVVVVGTIVGVATNRLLARRRLVASARLGLVVAAVACAFVAAAAAAASVGVELGVGVFPFVVLAGFAERLAAVAEETGSDEVARLALGTVAGAILLAALVGSVSGVLDRAPDLTLLAVPVCVALGGYTGLRAVELVRFREIR
ncbi:MAG: 7TM domain-containing protein [Acidimicrobiales bacterium]